MSFIFGIITSVSAAKRPFTQNQGWIEFLNDHIRLQYSAMVYTYLIATLDPGFERSTQMCLANPTIII